MLLQSYEMKSFRKTQLKEGTGTTCSKLIIETLEQGGKHLQS